MIEWACNIETHVCQLIDKHVLHTIVILAIAVGVICVGWTIDAILNERHGRRH